MNCDDVTALLGADADGEVDTLRSHALRRHVAGCAACQQRAADLRELKQALRAALPRHAAPASLRDRVTRTLPVPVPTAVQAPRRWPWFSAGVLSGGMAAALLWMVASAWPPGGSGADWPARVVALHTRATLGHQLIAVASSDRHTVKPWLSARLDYTIPVLDAADAGFALLGARIDQLDGGRVAVLVYRHRQHLIDVWVRPLSPGAPMAGAHTVRGFNVAAAQGAQMSWLAASDLNAPELEAFVSGLAAGQVRAAGP